MDCLGKGKMLTNRDINTFVDNLREISFLCIWNISGIFHFSSWNQHFTCQDDYDRLRPLSYQNANLVLVCYDVTNPTSFENVLIKWYPEVNHFCRDVPVILIGCKTDLRKDKERTRRLKAMDQAPITYTQGEETRRHMSAELYLECSAKYRENVEDIFRDATKKALASSRRARQRTKKRHCVIL
ncbi:rho-related GTP-binding protein RhoF-like isoform X2 [Oncorhynchus keta]|uniref:rho-related GTP-binding protein RhoF-like isoform X1 n=1 Tax=Oncorhynchus keta TaxID=8018 RepID=UPI00227A8891|nr:rho-related GTP-binding protein RhoF-like isoform X1 [Oncorhynchus keta]XP_052314014.1 rho-related GTP-binding protein RhoF-like isoform X2 [Oncorhynchus keta]